MSVTMRHRNPDTGEIDIESVADIDERAVPSWQGRGWELVPPEAPPAPPAPPSPPVAARKPAATADTPQED